MITNVVLLTQAAGSADSWNEIKKQLTVITSTSFICGLFITAALYMIISQYPHLQMSLMTILLGFTLTMSFVAICVATITR